MHSLLVFSIIIILLIITITITTIIIMSEIVSEPIYLRNVNTFDSLDASSPPQNLKQPAGSPVSKFLGRIQEGATALFTCGRTQDIVQEKEGPPSPQI
jgi:hypothetical protein